jgi:hypothetical protein
MGGDHTGNPEASYLVWPRADLGAEADCPSLFITITQRSSVRKEFLISPPARLA